MAYNSAYTGAQIDQAISDVRDNKDAWSKKQDALLSSGAAVGQTVIVKAVDANGKPTQWEAAALPNLPEVTTADNGKFLRVVNGAWAASEISDANGVSF